MASNGRGAGLRQTHGKSRGRVPGGSKQGGADSFVHWLCSPATARRRLRIVITAGPTREYFDSVRFISNPSTGKMGYAIAKAAAAAGHAVVLVSGPVMLARPKNVEIIPVVTAAEMLAAARRAFADADAAIFVAAVCDYRPKRRARKKLPKTAGTKSLVLVPTEDIAASLGRIKGRRVTVAFAMEDHAARPHAEQKLLRKNCDAIVLNSPRSVGSDTARVDFLVRGGKWQRWPAASKQGVARRIVRELERLAT